MAGGYGGNGHGRPSEATAPSMLPSEVLEIESNFASKKTNTGKVKMKGGKLKNASSEGGGEDGSGAAAVMKQAVKVKLLDHQVRVSE